MEKNNPFLDQSPRSDCLIRFFSITSSQASHILNCKDPFLSSHTSPTHDFFFFWKIFLLLPALLRERIRDSGRVSRGNFSQERPFPHGSPSTVVMYMFVVATFFLRSSSSKSFFDRKNIKKLKNPNFQISRDLTYFFIFQLEGHNP